MAKIVYTGCKVLVNSVDLSNHIEQVTLNRKDDQVETTAFGSAYHDFVAGLQTNTVTFTFQQDFAASSVQATLYPLTGSTTSFSVNSTASANSTVNPAFSGTILVSEWSPIDAQVGQLGKISVTYPVVSAISQATS
jgi:hypothetical protein